MAGQNPDNIRRLSSDDGSQSSSDSEYEYYHTDIFELLPSTQAVHSSQNTQPFQEGGPKPGQTLSRRLKDKESEQPLKNMALCIQAKKEVRYRRNMQISNIGSWESWRRSQSTNRRKVWAQIRGALTNLLPWQRTLHSIKGRFGIGVKAYFVFLRYLVYLNLLHCALIGGFILVPAIFYGNNKVLSETLAFGDNDSLLDFLQGSGYLERSPVFLGFYAQAYSLDSCMIVPLLYLGGILSILLLSLILVVHRTVVGYKHTWMLRKRYSMNVSYKIFCGWDFTIQDPVSASLKQSCIRNDLKLLLEEQRFSMQVAQRKLGQKVRLYLLRFILNVFVLSLLGGAFYLIYFAIRVRVDRSKYHWVISLVVEYLPPITITFVNLLLPHIFRKISSFEDYSFTMQVNATLLRSIFLKLASLGIYLFFIFTPDGPSCREKDLGKEMYKLSVFNFLAMFCNAFLFNFPRKLLQESCPSSLLARLCGKQRFLIPFNILDLVYGQTVSWMGVYYCPLLPLIGTITLVATFYIKKFTVLRCCVPEQRMFRASNSSVLFHFMLLLGLTMAAVTLGFYLYLEAPGNQDINCSKNNETMFTIVEKCVASLPNQQQKILRYFTSEAFALPLLLAEIVLLTSYVSRGRANQKTIERLKDMLVMSSSDKRFLVNQHATIVKQ
ncbi:transmembrane channel-like protein 7 isoform X1 [Takifugu flavidus]|uniref:transmembrane channel-like protein 7 isoform X1 n=2 Tax=Takifugu flavidus TaxID=433684 RepID=UPI002544B5C6|nr:transmembrane channel-like protein 7 isoform X1 [Takifugu flavidus]